MLKSERPVYMILLFFLKQKPNFGKKRNKKIVNESLEQSQYFFPIDHSIFRYSVAFEAQLVFEVLYELAQTYNKNCITMKKLVS